MFEVKDFSTVYDSIMQFNKNKSVSIHQWYPFVEGYSKEFIDSILDEIDYTPNRVLEPFSGSGTTALELQFKNINCISFEVSPFMHLLSSVKLYKEYKAIKFESVLANFKIDIESSPLEIRDHQKIPFGRTVIKTENLKKWNFNDEALNGILDLKFAISKISDLPYANLFSVILGSILMEVSNLFRNGKCLSYKKNWNERKTLSRTEVHALFINKIEKLILNDIKSLESKLESVYINNHENLHFGDVRRLIQSVPANSIDLIITSPPYLNSRDYTDIYMLELKVLDLVTNHDELMSLRKRTLRSHVQVKYDFLETVNVPTLIKYIKSVNQSGSGFWNQDLLNMIKGYFIDMQNLFIEFRRVMQPRKNIYFNVANSAYFGQEIEVDQIICEIAIQHGFELLEIRKARNLKASSQQSGTIKHLRESVIVLRS
jgi:DNA modification methylase